MPSGTLKAWESSVPGFPTSKDRLTVLLGARAAGNSSLKPILVYPSENPWAPKNYVESTEPVLCKWNNKAWMAAHLMQQCLLTLFSVETCCSEKRIPFKIFLLTDSVPKGLMEMHRRVVFKPPNTISHGLRNRNNFDFKKVIATIGGSFGKVNWKTFGQDSSFWIPLRIFVIHGKRSKINITGAWKSWFQTSWMTLMGSKLQWRK